MTSCLSTWVRTNVPFPYYTWPGPPCPHRSPDHQSHTPITTNQGPPYRYMPWPTDWQNKKKRGWRPLNKHIEDRTWTTTEETSAGLSRLTTCLKTRECAGYFSKPGSLSAACKLTRTWYHSNLKTSCVIPGFPAPVCYLCDQFQRKLIRIRNLYRSLAVL